MRSNLEERIADLIAITARSKDYGQKPRFSHINLDLVLGMFEQGFQLKQISKFYGCTDQTLSKYIKKVIPGFEGRAYKHFRDEKRAREIKKKILALYKKLGSCERVGENLHMAPNYVGRILKNAGIKIREKYRTDVSTEEIQNLYENLKNATKVGRILGISTALVCLRLRKVGISTARDPIANPLISSTKSPEPPKEKAIEAYQRGGFGLMMKEFHIGYYRAKQIITDEGIGARARLPKWRRLGLPIKEITSLYPKLSVKALGIKYGLCYYTMRKLLVDEGLEVRGGRKRTDIPEEEAVRMYKEKPSIIRICKRYGAGSDTIKRILLNAGVKLVPYFKN